MPYMFGYFIINTFDFIPNSFKADIDVHQHKYLQSVFMNIHLSMIFVVKASMAYAVLTEQARLLEYLCFSFGFYQLFCIHVKW